MQRLDTPDLLSSLSAEPLFIFDFDCCLLPTVELQSLGLSLNSTYIDSSIRKELDALGDVVVATLSMAKSLGRVCIVTNAESGWVQLTTALFFPLQAPFFASLDVFSARSIFEPQGFASPLDWKIQAFDFVVASRCADLSAANFQIVSIGDSLHEREAVISVCSSRGLLYKSIKMLDRPDFSSLARQHQLLQKRLPHILSVSSSLDVRVHLVDVDQLSTTSKTRTTDCPLSDEQSSHL